MDKKILEAFQVHRAGDPQRALTLYQSILSKKKFQATYDLLHMMGLASYQVGRLNESHSYYTQALKINSNDPTLYNHLSLLYKAQGHLSRALEQVNKALDLDPRHYAALNNLGNILIQSGDLAGAEIAYRRAWQVDPTLNEAPNNIILILMRTARMPEALDLCEKILKSNSPDAIFYNNYANVLHGSNRNSEALINADNSLALNPNFPEAHLSKSNILKSLGRYEEAIQECLSALALRGSYPEANNNLGLLYVKVGRSAEAIEALSAGISASPRYRDAYNNRGLVYKSVGKPFQAMSDFYHAVSLDNNYCDALNNLGNMYKDTQDYDIALRFLNRAIDSNPLSAEALNNRATVYLRKYDLDAAMKDLRAALDIRQDFPHAHLNLGTLYLEMGDLSEAKRALETALVQKPDFNDALFNLSLVHLLKGDYENGWPLYEARWKRSQGLEQMKYKRLPLLSSLRNLSTKRVLVWCEQGLGDSIQFARYLDHLAKLSGRVAFHCQSILYKLLERANLGVDLFDKEVEQKNYDFQIPLMSLPGLFYSSGYHQTPPPLRLDIPLSNLEHWASQMKCEKSTIKVGLSWQGSKATIVDIGRSIPLHLFKELLGVPSVRFYSLQKGYGSEQVESIAFPIEVLSNMDDGRESAFLDTAAVIKNLDLVVTSDTAVAHLAGSLRVPTWVLLKKSPDWRWGFTSNQSHWYESVTLFRQAKVGDWVEVLRRVKSALSSLTPGGGLLL